MTDLSEISHFGHTARALSVSIVNGKYRQQVSWLKKKKNKMKWFADVG